MSRRSTWSGNTFMRGLGVTAALVAVTLVAAPEAMPVPAATQVKAFPAGCWIGARPFVGTFASGPVQAKVTNGKLKLALWVGTGPSPAAVGFMTVTGIGAGSLKISGSELVLEVKVLGDYDLTGSPSVVKVNGTYSMTGSAIGAGQFAGTYPVNVKYPLHNKLLTIQTVSPTHVAGLFGKAPWATTRRAGKPSTNAGACAAAAS